MPSQTFPVIDVSAWDLAGEEQLGTKPKRWLKDPDTEELRLMKDVTFSEPIDAPRYPKGDNWSERIASAVAELVGLPCAKTELATVTNEGVQTSGVISRKIHAEDEQLEHGDVLLAEIGVMVGRKSRNGYTTEAIRQLLISDDVAEIGPPTPGWLSAWEVFVGYLVLDAVVGNTDRHEENWAVVSGAEGRRLAPTYDHASSLGFQLADSHRQDRLTTNDDGYSVEAYADRARSQYAGKPSPVSVACDGLASVEAPARTHWLEAVSDLEALVAPVHLVPDEQMSDSAREFAERMIRHNRSRLLSHHSGTV